MSDQSLSVSTSESLPAADVDGAVFFALGRILAALCFGIAIVLAAVTAVTFGKATLAFFAAAPYTAGVSNVTLGILLGERGLG